MRRACCVRFGAAAARAESLLARVPVEPPIPAAALAIAALALAFFWAAALADSSGRSRAADRHSVRTGLRVPSSRWPESHGLRRHRQLALHLHQCRVSQERAGMVHLSFDVSRHLDLSLRRKIRL